MERKKYTEKQIVKRLAEALPEDVVYINEQYLIVQRGSHEGGSLMVPFELFDIALDGIDQVHLFKYKKDFEKIMRENIARLEKMIQEYPEDK